VAKKLLKSPLRGSVPMSSGPVLIALASLRNTEAQLRWQGAQWSVTLNVSALVALMYRMLSRPELLEFVVLTTGCAIVAGLNFVWYNILRRDGKLFNFWNKKILEHESVNGIDGGIKIFTSDRYQQFSLSRDRLQRRLERVTVALIYVWMMLSVGLLTWTLTLVKGGV